MIEYRTFSNIDPPSIRRIWNSQTGVLGILPAHSVDVLEQLVFSKPYFDSDGLILACEKGRAIGFGHAGFGPNEAETALMYDIGATCMLVVEPRDDQRLIGAELLLRCEQYLRSRGAKVLYGGSIRPLDPFYFDLYGGSEMPGVLESDLLAQSVFRAAGYKEIDRTVAFRRSLVRHDRSHTGESPPTISWAGKVVQPGDSFQVVPTADAPTASWWQACAFAPYELTRFDLVDRATGSQIGHVMFRNLEPPGTALFSRQVGLIDLEIEASRRRHGLATFLLNESFHWLTSRRLINLIEVQTTIHNTAAIRLYEKLGFRHAREASVFRQETGARSLSGGG